MPKLPVFILSLSGSFEKAWLGSLEYLSLRVTYTSRQHKAVIVQLGTQTCSKPSSTSVQAKGKLRPQSP